MHLATHWSALAVIVVLSVANTGLAQATKTIDQFFPNTTKGFLSATDMQTLADQWNETQLGMLADDPLIKPFLDDLREQIRQDRAQDRIDWGIKWDDVNDLARGETAVGLIHTPGRRPARAILVDVTDNQQAAVGVLNKIFQSLNRQRATWKQEKVAGRDLTVFSLPRSAKDPQRPPQVAYFIKNNFLGAVEDGAVARQIMQRMDASANDTLASLAHYQTVMKRCAADAELAGPKEVGARWYVAPLEYAQARRVVDPQVFMSDKLDMITVLKNSGFGGMQAIGGFMHLRTGDYDMLHRIAVYAPPPFEKSLRMLATPNDGPFPPFEWLPANLSSYTSGSWDMKTAVENIESLYDQTVGNGDEGVWRDALASIREDREGPQIDMEKQLFPHLGTRLTRISDVREPITVSSERNMIIVDLRDAKAVQAALEKYYAKDPLATKKTEGDHSYWEIEPEEDYEDDEPAAKVGNPALSGGKSAGANEPNEPTGLAIAFDRLLVASHVSLLREVLTGGQQNSLAEDPQYQRVASLIQSEKEKRSWDKTCIWRFVRSDLAYRPTYELTRKGQLPQSKSLIGEALNMIMEPGAGGQPRKQKADGSKLPEYDKVKHYLTPFGGLGVREEGKDFQGWFFIAFGLSADQQKKAAGQ